MIFKLNAMKSLIKANSLSWVKQIIKIDCIEIMSKSWGIFRLNIFFFLDLLILFSFTDDGTFANN